MRGQIDVIKKVGLLLQIAFRDPQEFYDRMEAILTSRLERVLGRRGDYRAQTKEDALDIMEQALGKHIDWEGLDEIKHEVRRRMDDLGAKAPFTTKHHGDFGLAEVCYAACRLLKPEIVVETGVAYGVTTAFILEALHMNKRGRLVSIDLPPLGDNADAFVGFLVPEELRDRWILYRGTSKRILPKLLPQMERIDLFIHDSLHTYWNIRRELTVVTPYLNRPAVVVVDDIDGNRAYAEWIAEVRPVRAVTFQEEGKDALAGLTLFV